MFTPSARAHVLHRVAYHFKYICTYKVVVCILHFRERSIISTHILLPRNRIPNMGVGFSIIWGWSLIPSGGGV